MITPLPTPPTRQDPSNFSQRADDFMGALPAFATETNATAVAADADAASALQSKIDAAASAAGANASANVTKWVSGTTYQNGDVVWSPANTFSYRRKTSAGGGTTDPSADGTNYTLVSGAGNVQTDLVQTLSNKALDITCTLAKLSSGTSTWNTAGVIDNVVGQLAWKVFGNNHTVFDASAGTSPTGSAVNSVNPANFWSADRPVLMGWNGSETYGVRVDYTRWADTSGNANTATTDAQHIGIGQTWQNLSASRSSGITYSNTTGKPISVYVSVINAIYSAAVTFSAVVGGVEIVRFTTPNNVNAIYGGGGVSFIVPNGASYSVTASTFNVWSELR